MSYFQGHKVKKNDDNLELTAISPADFERLTSVITSNIKKINSKAREIDQKVELFDKNQASSNFREQLFTLQEKAGQLCQDTQRHLKEISHFSQSENSSNQLQQNTQVSQLAHDFEEALKAISTVQSRVAAKEKTFISRARLSSSQNDESTPEPQDASLLHGSQTQTLMQANANLKEVEQREEEFHKLENRIMDVNQIFRDLSTMVEEQGETIDSIEAHVSSAANRVEEGNVKLQKAVKSQSKSRKKKFVCWLVIALVIILVIVIIIVSIVLT